MSTNPTQPTSPDASTGAWARLHLALMPDYNRRAALYWWFTVLLGMGIFGLVLYRVLSLPAAELTVVLAGVAMAMLAALFPVRILRWKNAFTAGEIFVFLLLLLQGPAAATLAAAAETLLGSCRTSKRWTSRLASPAMASIAMFGVASTLHAGLAALEARGQTNPGWLLLAMMLGAVAYFGLNTLLITAVFHLKRGVWPAARELFGNFGWIGITFVASASIASLLFLSFQASGIGVLMAAAPIIGLLLLTLHYHSRQQEADEAARMSRLDAAEREAQLAASHVEALQASERRFHSAFSHASIGMALVGFDARILQANAALRDLLGLAREEELEAQALIDFVDAGDRAGLLTKMGLLQRGELPSFADELRLRLRSDAELWVAVHGSLFTEIGSDTPCLILQVQDVTARRVAEAGLQHIAFHDSLTGLPNRHRFQQLLEAALVQARACTGKPFGLLFLDFDRFKLINDSLGHAVGDQFLVAVSQRIKQQLRPADVVARLGGDEFAILAVDLDSEHYAVGLAGRLLEAVRQPFRIAGTDLSTSVSIGITFSGTGYTSPNDMLRDADTAMYKAKASGKARYALFDSALHIEVSHRMQLEGDLRRALADGAIGLDYQPLYDLFDGRLIGFEALARWQHPELGAIEPKTFVPVAEDAGMVVTLTDFVLNAACRQLQRWQQRDGAFAELHLHVNLSGIDVAHPGLVSRVNLALADARLKPQHLTLELTENTLMQRLDGALPALTQLRQSGIGLAIDDFGAGYSSLRHLPGLPVDSLKLDCGFVADLERGIKEETVVRAIVMMGQSLGKTVMAEGIESAGQLARLKQAGCQAGQGFFLSRPLPPEAVDALLERLLVDAPRAALPAPDTRASQLH